MLRALFLTLKAVLGALLGLSALLELAGAGLIVTAVWRHWGMDAGLGALGAALMLKALVADLGAAADRAPG